MKKLITILMMLLLAATVVHADVWVTKGYPLIQTVAGIEQEIEVLNVPVTEDACQIRVGGKTEIIDINGEAKFDKLKIKVNDARIVDSELGDVYTCDITTSEAAFGEVFVSDITVKGADNVGAASSIPGARFISSSYSGVQIFEKSFDLPNNYQDFMKGTFQIESKGAYKIIVNGIIIADEDSAKKEIYSVIFEKETNIIIKADDEFAFKIDISKQARIPFNGVVCNTLNTGVVHGGIVGCDVNVFGAELDLSKTYCKGVDSSKKFYIGPDGYGRPDRYYSTLSGLKLGEEVEVIVTTQAGQEIVCSPNLNTGKFDASCPSKHRLSEQIKSCLESGEQYDMYIDNPACVRVRCLGITTGYDELNAIPTEVEEPVLEPILPVIEPVIIQIEEPEPIQPVVEPVIVQNLCVDQKQEKFNVGANAYNNGNMQSFVAEFLSTRIEFYLENIAAKSDVSVYLWADNNGVPDESSPIFTGVISREVIGGADWYGINVNNILPGKKYYVSIDADGYNWYIAQPEEYFDLYPEGEAWLWVGDQIDINTGNVYLSLNAEKALNGSDYAFRTLYKCQEEQPKTCPSDKEIQAQFDKCKDDGLGHIKKTNHLGCIVVECKQKANVKQEQTGDLCESNLDCNDNNSCTADLCSGTPKDCSYNALSLGCTYDDDVCLPIGTRVDTEYCDIDKTMKPQKNADLQCSNNYECDTNVCINDQCIESGVIQKFIEWFVGLFGSD